MISLIQIRAKYVMRHYCLLFWTYIFLPSIILLAAIIQLSDREKYNKIPYQEHFETEEKTFFKDTYQALGNIMSATVFVVENNNTCDTIIKYINEMTSAITYCTNNENNNLKGIYNIIKIKEKNDKYRIFLNLKSLKYIFSRDDLIESKIVNPFIEGENYDFKNDDFFELQSLLSKLLIKMKGITEFEGNFKMTFGFNPYPDHYNFADDNNSISSSLLSFLVCLQFSLFAYNFNMRMIDEKENKLNILLERQGISKFKYFFSWFLTFYTLCSFSIFPFLMLFLGVLISHYFLLFIIFVCFTLTNFSVCVFFTTCFKTIKAGSTGVKFYNFGSLFLGFVILMYSTSKVTKIIFCFIPQINIYVSLNCLFFLNNFENLTWDLLWLRADKMSIMENIIMYIASILFYFGLSFFIESYKNSGLPFILYLKSFFVKVSRTTDKNSSLLIENDTSEKINVNYETNHQELSPINQQKKEQNNCLKILNVSKNFDDLKAVDNFNGELFPDEIFCLLGHNGAGKTTLINMISGILDPDHGDILLNNLIKYNNLKSIKIIFIIILDYANKKIFFLTI